MQEKDTDENNQPAAEEQDWLPEASKEVVRCRPRYQEVSGAPSHECEACQ